MKKLNTSVALAALAAVFVAAPAVAADFEAPAPEVVDWTAFHIGVGGGGNFLFVDEEAIGDINSNDLANANNFLEIDGDHFSDLGKAGFFGTVEAGFDYQLGSSVVVGVLANYDFGKTKVDNESSATIEVENLNGNTFFADDDGQFETSWKVGDSWGVGGRIGFLAMDNALVYVMGGYTQANVKSSGSISGFDNNNNFFSFSASDGKWEDGYFVGGGIEALLTESISLKGEYRFSDYGKVERSASFEDVNTNTFAQVSQEGDITIHSIRAVLSYRFGL
ncbi:MAG: outer membrane protein [Parvibaculaceae bacterium]